MTRDTLMAELQKWVQATYPEARWASVLVDRGDGVPCERLVIVSSSIVPSHESSPARF